MSSAVRVSSSRGSGNGLPPDVFVLVRLMLRCVLDEGSARFATDGELVGDVDMRSLSGSSEAFRLRPDILGVLKGSA